MKNIHRIVAALCLGMMLSLFAAQASAASSRFKNIVVSDHKGASESQDELSTDTAKIFLRATFARVKPGTTLSAVWIAVKVKGVRPNFEITRVSVVIGDQEDQFNASLTRPDGGWPAGDYKVDLYIGDDLEDSAEFSLSSN